MQPCGCERLIYDNIRHLYNLCWYDYELTIRPYQKFPIEGVIGHIDFNTWTYAIYVIVNYIIIIVNWFSAILIGWPDVPFYIGKFLISKVCPSFPTKFLRSLIFPFFNIIFPISLLIKNM